MEQEQLLSALTWLGIKIQQSRVYLFTLTLLDSSCKFLQMWKKNIWNNARPPFPHSQTRGDSIIILIMLFFVSFPPAESQWRSVWVREQACVSGVRKHPSDSSAGTKAGV